MSSRAVLVVDDDPIMRFCLQRLLQSEGYAVRTAADPDAALAALEADRPDAVILDIVLDTSDGYAFCRHLKSAPSHDGLKIVMVSARARPDEVERGRAAGADGYLAKPFGVAALKQALDDVFVHPRA